MKKVSLRFAALMAAMMMTMITSAQQNDSLSTDTTMWFNQTHELSGVVVKGRLPKTRVKGLQVNDMLYYVGPDQVTGHSTQEIRYPWHAWSPQLQLNYMVNENHTFGAYYKYDRTPSGETKGDYLTDMFENSILTEHSASYIWQDQSIKKHIFNAYYNGKVGQLGIDLNIDGLFDDTKTPGRTFLIDLVWKFNEASSKYRGSGAGEKQKARM